MAPDQSAGQAAAEPPSDETEALRRRIEELEQELRIKQAHLEFATDGIWDWDLISNHEYMSERFWRMLGYDPADMPSHPSAWQAIIHPDDGERALQLFEAHTSEGVPYSLPVRYRHREGHWVWVICRGKALQNERGEWYRMLGCHQDISALMEAQQSARRAAFALDHIDDSIVWCDLEGRLIYGNQSFFRRMSYTPAMLKARRLQDVVLHPALQEWPQFVAEIREQGARHLSSYPIQRGNGTRFTGRVYAAMVASEDEAFLLFSIGRVFVSRDQSAQSELQFESAFAHAPIGMALVAPDGRWLRVNPAICAITGYAEEDLLGMTFQDITHPEDLKDDLALVDQLLAGERDSYQMRKRYLHKNGSAVWVLLSVSLVRDASGQPIHFIAQIQDISEMVAASLQLEHGNLELQRLLETLSHDLREPLRKISLFASKIQMPGTTAADGEQLGRWLQRIVAASGRLELLFEDLQVYLRLRKAPYRPRALTLRNLIDDLSAEFSDQLQCQGTEITVDELPTVWADEPMLANVFRQLMSNAIKFQHPQRPLQIRLFAAPPPSPGITRIVFEDNGIGIDPEFHRHAFQLFRRGQELPAGNEGTGLGLAIVDKAIHRHQGSVALQETPGGGTQVIIDLPARFGEQR